MFECLSDLNSSTCRTCLIVGSDMKSLFENNKGTNVLNMLTSITNKKVPENDDMPLNICLNCVLKVEQAFKFKQLCEQSYTILHNRILLFKNENSINSQKNDGNEFLPNEIIYEGDLKNVCVASDNVESIDLPHEANIIPLIDKKTNLKLRVDIIKSNEVTNSDLNVGKQNKADTFEIKLQPMCKYCNKKFCNKYYLKVHLHKVHNKSSIAKPFGKFPKASISEQSFSNESGKFSCKDCRKTFNKLVSLNLHRRVHQPGYTKYRHQCTYCGKLFERPADCREHTRTHTGEQPFQCTHCSKRYSHRKSLYFHMIKHSEEKYVVCPVCGKRLASRGCLDAHMKTHDGVRSHKCPECIKAFYFKSQLSVHMRQHTGEKPYICSSCEATFATSGQLKCHLRKHTS